MYLKSLLHTNFSHGSILWHYFSTCQRHSTQHGASRSSKCYTNGIFATNLFPALAAFWLTELFVPVTNLYSHLCVCVCWKMVYHKEQCWAPSCSIYSLKSNHICDPSNNTQNTVRWWLGTVCIMQQSVMDSKYFRKASIRYKIGQGQMANFSSCKSKKANSVGCTVVLANDVVVCYPRPPFFSIDSAELFAILLAVYHILEMKHVKGIFCSDSFLLFKL